MLECGFQKKPCNEQCALYIRGTKECAIVSIAALLEGMHNIGVLAHDKYVKKDPYEDYDEDELAAALIAGSKKTEDYSDDLDEEEEEEEEEEKK